MYNRNSKYENKYETNVTRVKMLLIIYKSKTYMLISWKNWKMDVALYCFCVLGYQFSTLIRTSSTRLSLAFKILILKPSIVISSLISGILSWY